MVRTGAEVKKKKQEKRYLGATGSLVDRRIRRLQSDYLAGKSTARRDLAELRRALSRAPGEVPAVWALTEVPGGDRAGTAPMPSEWAVHIAMTLYGVHQQGRPLPVYDGQIPFASAVRALANETSEEGTPEKSPIWRRFTAAMLANDVEGTREHLQSIVGQMHSAKRLLAFDYGGLARDLERMQYPGGSEAVKLRWQREFYRTTPQNPSKTEDIKTDEGN